LRKANALYYEFEEIGLNRQLGYESPADIVDKYPRFYWNNVSLHIQAAIDYLQVRPAPTLILLTRVTALRVIISERPRMHLIISAHRSQLQISQVHEPMFTKRRHHRPNPCPDHRCRQQVRTVI
jgi:hypothetical protein